MSRSATDMNKVKAEAPEILLVHDRMKTLLQCAEREVSDATRNGREISKNTMSKLLVGIREIYDETTTHLRFLTGATMWDSSKAQLKSSPEYVLRDKKSQYRDLRKISQSKQRVLKAIRKEGEARRAKSTIVVRKSKKKKEEEKTKKKKKAAARQIPTRNSKKNKEEEKFIFGEEIGLGLRPYQCGRILDRNTMSVQELWKSVENFVDVKKTRFFQFMARWKACPKVEFKNQLFESWRTMFPNRKKFFDAEIDAMATEHQNKGVKAGDMEPEWAKTWLEKRLIAKHELARQIALKFVKSKENIRFEFLNGIQVSLREART